jgi:hypothetical protein
MPDFSTLSQSSVLSSPQGWQVKSLTATEYRVIEEPLLFDLDWRPPEWFFSLTAPNSRRIVVIDKAVRQI